MKWASSLAVSANLSDGITRAAAEVRRQLDGARPDLVLAFVSPHFESAYGKVPALIRQTLPCDLLLGCTAGGVIGGGIEVENKPAISLTAAQLPGVALTPIHSDTQDLPDEDASPDVWRSWLGLSGCDQAHFIVLADPFSAALEPFLTGLDYAFPSGAKIGGLASGGNQAGANALYLGEQCFTRGLVAVALSGPIIVDTIVAQGCRPIGRPLTVTQCRQNLLLTVDQQTPLAYLGQLVEELNEADRQLMRTSLFLGLAMDPFNPAPGRGDFLIRNLVGIDYTTGTLAIGALLQEGQVVQFHLRDKVTSAEDLDLMLSRYSATGAHRNVAGALLFSCLGRGQYLYGEANHDSNAFRNMVAPVPLGGFFCNGEIGPIGSATHIHGYTSSFGIFRPSVQPQTINPP